VKLSLNNLDFRDEWHMGL